MELAPAIRPASPVSRTRRGSTPAPATPMIRQKFDTRPSFAPSTAARNSFPAPPRCQRSALAISKPIVPCGRPPPRRNRLHHGGMALFLGGQGCRVGLAGVLVAIGELRGSDRGKHES